MRKSKRQLRRQVWRMVRGVIAQSVGRLAWWLWDMFGDDWQWGC
jgi:hypothetical protein